MSRAHLEKSGYLKSFPNLLGCVCAPLRRRARDPRRVDRFDDGRGLDRRALEPADLVLAPAACYPVYPMAAARGAGARPTA